MFPSSISGQLASRFVSVFHQQPRCFRAPGRINLIGEHTDYNDGFVMPAGIDAACYIAITRSQVDRSTFIAADLDDRFTFSTLPQQKTDTRWANYLLGVIHAFQKRGFEVPHLELMVTADVPVGAGLSSSAALESVMAIAIDQLLGCGLSKMELTRIAKEAENAFVGLQCGIMDMFASIHAKKDHAMMLDCRSLQFEYVPITMGENRILLFDTGVKHDLATTEYNTRRLECQSVVDALRSKGHGVQSLRDVSLDMLEVIKDEVGFIKEGRARFVIEENQRLHDFAKAMKAGNWTRAGQLLYRSHNGLRDLYQVSCPELDTLVELVKGCEGAWGGRMMGGGFGGCTINLVPAAAIEGVVETVRNGYRSRYGVEPKCYIATTGDGACEI